MQIFYLGNYCFKIKAKESSIIVGAYKDSPAKAETDVLLTPNQNSNSAFRRSEGKPLIINAPGEYEIKGISIFGIKNAYVIEAEDIKVGFLSNYNSGLTVDQLEEMNEVDVLLIEVSENSLSQEQAVKLVNEVQPKIVCLGETPGSAKFLQELGQESMTKDKKLIVSKISLPQEMTSIILEAKNG